MNRAHHWLAGVGLILAGSAGIAQGEGRLGVTDAWIRAAPAGAQAMSGYATLTNTGDAPISLRAVQSDAFRLAAVRDTVVVDGVSKMRELQRLNIGAGESVELEPGGKHLMLMQPRHDIAVGERVEMLFMLGDGTRLETHFEVVADARDD